MKYQALAYQGFCWLKYLGEFETFEGAADALTEEHNKYCQGDAPDSDDYQSNSEVFWFDSRIETVISLAIGVTK
jgi:hypothetical protein